VAVKEFGDDFKLIFDDLNGDVRTYKSSNFIQKSITDSCETVAKLEDSFDSQICGLIEKSISKLQR
jgi:hypothetical protein